MPKPVPWFKVQAAAEGSGGEVSIRGYIGDWGVNDSEFISSVEALGDVDEISVRINSRGGEVDHAFSIFNFLKSHPARINVRVDGVAMSAASIIAMAGDEIVMPANTLMMVHNPWVVAAGSAEELRKRADDLDKYESALRETYMARTGLSEDEIKTLLDDTTYMTAAEAVEWGFADRVESIGKKASALAAVAFAGALSIPEDVLAKIEAAEQVAEEDEPENDPGVSADEDVSPETDPAQDDDLPAAASLTAVITTAAAEAGLQDYAAVFALDSALDNVDAIVRAMDDAREIIALSDLAGKPALADGMIRQRLTLNEARAALQNAVAEDDESRDTDNHIPVSGQPAQPSAPRPVTTGSIWAARKAAR